MNEKGRDEENDGDQKKSARIMYVEEGRKPRPAN